MLQALSVVENSTKKDELMEILDRAVAADELRRQLNAFYKDTHIPHTLQQVMDVRSRLALLTASVYVVILRRSTFEEKQSTLSGVCQETPTEYYDLDLTLDRGEVITITKSNYYPSPFCIYLSAGGNVSFKVVHSEEEDWQEEIATVYTIHAFATSDEAKKWMAQHPLDTTSR